MQELGVYDLITKHMSNTENKEGMVKYGQDSFYVASNKWSTITTIVIAWFIPALNMEIHLAHDILSILCVICLILTLVEIATSVRIWACPRILKINHRTICHYCEYLATVWY